MGNHSQVINGVLYDTATATEIAYHSVDDDYSDASWTLYRTPKGAYFELVGDENGAYDCIKPLSEDEAKDFVERWANGRYKELWPTSEPLAVTSPFRRITVISAVRVLEAQFRRHADWTNLFLLLGPGIPSCVDAEATTMAEKANKLIVLYDQRPARKLDGGQPIADFLIGEAISRLPAAGSFDTEPSYTDVQWRFIRALDLDGFVIKDGLLRRSLPEEIGLPGAEDEVERLLSKHGFSTLRNHLDQAVDAHARGKWEAANAQIRTFFEGLLDEIAIKLDSNAASLQNHNNRLQSLNKIGFLDSSRNEFCADGKGFVSGLYKRLCPDGSHPGASDQEDSTFRRHIVLLAARLFLVRFDQWERRP